MAAARGVGGNLAIRMETMAKVADNAVIASGHSRLFLSVNEVQWLLARKRCGCDANSDEGSARGEGYV